MMKKNTIKSLPVQTRRHRLLRMLPIFPVYPSDEQLKASSDKLIAKFDDAYKGLAK